MYYYTYPADTYRIPETYFWNLAVETEFANSLAFEASLRRQRGTSPVSFAQ